MGDWKYLLSWKVMLNKDRDCDMVKNPERVLTVPGEVDGAYRLV